MRFFIDHITSFLRWSERYTKTDMVYLMSTGWWTNLGTVVISLLSLVLYVIFANFLSKEVYGTYQYLLSFGAIIAALTLTGLNSSVVRSVARGFEGALQQAVQAQLRWFFVPFLVSLGISAYYFFNDNSLLALGLLIIAVLVPLNAIFNLYSAFLNGKKDFRRGFWYGMGWNIPFYSALIIAALVSNEALILLGVNLLSQTFFLFFLYRKVLKVYKPKDITDPETVPYGRHLSVMNFLNMVAAQADTVLAFHYLGAADLARYSFATAIPERIGGFFKFLQTAALPKLSEKDPSQIRTALGARVWWAVLVTALGAAVYAFFAPHLFNLLFPAYVEVIPYTQLYGITLIASLSGLFITGLTAGHSVRSLYLFNIVSPIVQLGLQLGGVLLYGLWGLIIGKLLSNFASLFFAVFLIRKP